MGIDNLPMDDQKRVRWILDWIGRMAAKHGGTVYEKDDGCWDLGQALCRECYGKDWMSVVPETPSWDDIHRAQEWEQGKIPDWVDQERTRRKSR